MRLKAIKERYDISIKFYFRLMELIKSRCNIPQSENMFYFGWVYYLGNVFLCGGKIFVVRTDKDGYFIDEDVANSVKLTDLRVVTLLKDYPKNEKDIIVKTILSGEDFKVEDFLFWADSPCDINTAVDAPFYEIIKFLNGYKKDLFQTERYVFYPKKDDDYNFTTSFYAYDKKLKTEIKLYTFDNWADDKCIPPQKLMDIVVDDLSENLSDYQKRQCKRAFLKLANEINEVFKVENYWVMELIKYALQPYFRLQEWSLHRVFCRQGTFSNLWVYDFPKENEEPFFIFVDERFKEVAAFKFGSAEYYAEKIYKKGDVKVKCFEPDIQFLKEMTEFLKAPSERAEKMSSASGSTYEAYKKYVKTNWQQLIFEYNHNSAGWGWGENGFDIPPEKESDRLSDAPALPFDLQLPDYTKLAKDK